MVGDFEKECMETIMSETLKYVDPSINMIRRDLSELERVKEELLMTSSSDKLQLQQLTMQFEYKVCMMVITVNECRRHLAATYNKLRQLSNRITVSDNKNVISLGEGLILATLFVGLWPRNKCYGAIAIGLAAGTMTYRVHSRRSNREKHAQLELDIALKLAEIDQYKCELQSFVSEAKLIVQELHNNNIPVIDVPTLN